LKIKIPNGLKIGISIVPFFLSFFLVTKGKSIARRKAQPIKPQTTKAQSITQGKTVEQKSFQVQWLPFHQHKEWVSQAPILVRNQNVEYFKCLRR